MATDRNPPSAGAPDEPDLDVEPPEPPGDEAFLDLYPDERDGSRESLRRERDFWKHLFDSLAAGFPEGLLVMDADATLTHWNEAHEEVSGIPAEEAIGRQAYDVLGTEGEEETLAEEIARTGETVREEKVRTGRDEDGNAWHVRAAGTPLLSPDGEVAGVFEYVSEVTGLVEQRRQLERLQEEMAEEVQGAVDDLLATTEQVSGGSQEIGGITADQVRNLEDVRSEVERLSATIEEIASSAEEVNERSQAAESLAESSHETAESTLSHVDEVEAVGETLAENTDDLRDRVDEIDRIVHAIDEIAEQIDLLALNANIEAARTAEGGEGFAVVADEIKVLAEQSKDEAAEIEGIVGDITATIETTAKNVETANERIEAAVDQIGVLMDNQVAIIEAISETSVGMDEIADATGEQSRSAEEVTAMLREAVAGVEDVSGEIDDLAAANQRQVERVEAIRESIERIEAHLRETAEE